MDAAGEHGWRAVESTADARPGSTAKVYFNSKTGVSTFDKPDELKTAQERHRDGVLEGGETSSTLSRAVTNFDDIDEEDRAGRKTRLFKRNETQGYIDTASLDAASVDKPIGEENRGFRLLTKMGWKLGQGLGAKGDGITVPVVLGTQVATLGLGKAAEDDRFTDEAARERKKLDSEVVETEEMKAKRLEKAKRQETIKEQVQEMNKEFYCETCDKQYKNVSEMSNHYSSYDHHHVKRLKEAAEAEKARRGKTFNREKEQKKEWEEMQRRLKATQAATGGGGSGGAPPPPAPPAGDAPGIAPAEKRTTVKFGLGMKKPSGRGGGFRRR
ncbi:unnamed protein product [Hapterophycus canaliculatus]